jgi:hypothetical protein
MIFARSGEYTMDVPTPAAQPSGETQAYCDWTEREVAPCPDDRRHIESHASLDFDDEDAAWTALLAHARALAFETREADQWDALLADIPE